MKPSQANIFVSNSVSYFITCSITLNLPEWLYNEGSSRVFVTNWTHNLLFIF